MGFVRLPGWVALRKQQGVGAERCETTGVGKERAAFPPENGKERLYVGQQAQVWQQQLKATRSAPVPANGFHVESSKRGGQQGGNSSTTTIVGVLQTGHWSSEWPVKSSFTARGLVHSDRAG